MKCDSKMSSLIHSYFYDRLEAQRNASPNTVKTYRTAIKQFLLFLSDDDKREISYSMLTAEHVVAFLNDYVAGPRNMRSRNQRLAILKSLGQYACYLYPEDADPLRRISYISAQKEVKKVIAYLEQDEMRALLAAPDIATDDGRRHHVLLLFMYNTGARVSEVASLDINQLRLDSTQSVLIFGKGSKERVVPLWKETIAELNAVIARREHFPGEPVFLNKHGRRLTRRGITHILKTYSQKAAKHCLSLKYKVISPHSIRHTTAMHLLQSGVDLNVIRLWLGHVSIETTNVYVEADLNMKRKALAKAKMVVPAFSRKKWKPTEDVLSFLENL